MFWGCVYFNGAVYFFPNEYHKILKTDVENGADHVKTLKEIATLSDANRDILGSHYIFCKADHYHMMTYDKDGFLSEFRQGEDRGRRESLYIVSDNNADFKEFLTGLQNVYYEQENEALSETVFFTLEDYIRYIMNDTKNRKENPIE